MLIMHYRHGLQCCPKYTWCYHNDNAISLRVHIKLIFYPNAQRFPNNNLGWDNLSNQTGFNSMMM